MLGVYTVDLSRGSGQFIAILSAVGSGSPKWRQCSAEAPLRVRRMSLCLPGYYGEMCSSAVPLVPVRGAGVGCVGSRPTCHLGLRDFLGLRHAVFAPFPRSFRGFCLLAVCTMPRAGCHSDAAIVLHLDLDELVEEAADSMREKLFSMIHAAT